MTDDGSFDREAILARRRRFIALALAGTSAATAACSQACLSTHDAGRLDAGAVTADAAAPGDIGGEDAP